MRQTSCSPSLRNLWTTSTLPFRFSPPTEHLLHPPQVVPYHRSRLYVIFHLSVLLLLLIANVLPKFLQSVHRAIMSVSPYFLHSRIWCNLQPNEGRSSLFLLDRNWCWRGGFHHPNHHCWKSTTS